MRKTCDQPFCECLNSDCFGIAPAIIDSEVASIRPAELLKALLKYGHAGADIGIAFRNRHQHADTTNSLRLLRARRERPCGCCAAEQRDELAASHVEHGGFLPRSVCRTPSLPQAAGEVLGADLNCSESRRRRPA